jgi:protein tyrosine phosphatase type 4A
LKRKGVTLLVRTCAKTYNDELIKENGIEIEELHFLDGRGPPKEII